MFEEEEEEDDDDDGGIGVERAGDGVAYGGGVAETFIVVVVVVVAAAVAAAVVAAEEVTECDLVVERTGGLVAGLGGATVVSDGRLRTACCSRSERAFRTSFCLPSPPECAERAEAGDKTSAAGKVEDMEGLVHSDWSTPCPEDEG